MMSVSPQIQPSAIWTFRQGVVTVAASRAAIDDLCGSQNVLKAALQAVQRGNCTRAQSLLATGTGTAASPALLTYAGSISTAEVNVMFSN